MTTRSSGGLPLALELLVQCARSQLEARHVTRLRELATEVHWDDVARRAAWHRMLPLLYWHLAATCRDILPVDVHAALAREFALNAHRMLRLTAELTSVLSALRDRGIDALPYKGPMLAARLYGNLALRASGDLDIIVRPSDVLQARDVIADLGYRPHHSISAEQIPFMLARKYSETLVRPDVAHVELHWGFTNRDVPFELSFDDVMARARTTQLGQTTVPILGHEDLALVLCVHGAKHRWNRLEWIAGLSTLIRTVAGLDYDAVLSRASSLRSYRRALLGFLVSGELLDAPVPPAIVSNARLDVRILALCNEVLQSLSDVHLRSPLAERSASLPFDWFHLRLSDSLQDQWQLVSYRLTTPSQPGDWSTLTMGSHLVPLHAILRPVQVAVRIVPATWSFIQQRHEHRVRRPPRGSRARDLRRASSPARRSRDTLRILQLVQKPQRRGAELFAQQLSDEFRQLGHVAKTVYLYGGDGSSADQLTLRSDDVILGSTEDHLTERAPGVNPSLVRRLLAQVTEFDPDIIQLNGARTVKYGALLRLVQPRKSWRTVYRNIGDPRDWVPRGPKRVILRQLMAAIDGTVAISSQSLALLKAIYNVREPTIGIPNGIHPAAVEAKRARTDVRRTFGTSDDAVVVVFVGSLTTEKRVDVLLRAFQQVVLRRPSTRLWIVGTGPLRAELEREAIRLGVNHAVRFVGLSAEVGTLLAAADILALSSDTEGMPAVALEAGYHGLPVVSTRVGSMSDCVLHGETGLLAERGNPSELAAGITALVIDSDRRRRMGALAYQRVSDLFTVAKVARRYLAFFSDVLTDSVSTRGSAIATNDHGANPANDHCVVP
jgi:glycosyltransferase involved in cell wall biosynthesis